MLSIEIFLTSRSTCATNVRCSPDSWARSSCDHALAARSARTLAAKMERARGGVDVKFRQASWKADESSLH